jgi:serine protease Do/serine protease DegQ
VSEWRRGVQGLKRHVPWVVLLVLCTSCREGRDARAARAGSVQPSQLPREEDGRLVGDPEIAGAYAEPAQAVAALSPGRTLGHRTFAALFQVVSRSVVNLFTTRTRRPLSEDDAEDSLSRYEHFFGSQAREHLQRSLGSGFIIDRKGYILTNDHVIEDAEGIRVRLWNGREVEAKVVGRDPKTDLAIIKIPARRGLVPVVFGDSEKVAIGDFVAAIGNPFGLSHTMTVGVVSAKGRRSRTAEAIYDLIQTDATINPGNSGGPLLNVTGEVIGVTTSISALGKGIGFAIPISIAREVIPNLKLKGRVVRPWLGIYQQPVTQELAASFGLRRPQGALVAGVLEDSPAARAGIRQADILLEFDGKKLKDSDDLRFRVYRAPVGRTVKVVIFREKKRYDATLLLEPEPEDQKPSSEPAQKAPPVLGLILADADGTAGSGGVVVQGVIEGSVAWEAGLRQDDLILSINDVPVADMDAYRKEYANLAPAEVCRLKIRRRGVEQFVAFRALRE